MRNCPFTFQCLFSLVALAVTAGSAVPHQDPPADGLAVVLPDRPTIVERSAAKELADGLEKCLGKRPEIVAERDAREGRAPARGRAGARPSRRGKWTACS